MSEHLVVFDTSTLPEYYADVQKVLTLPDGHVVTYDYSTNHIDTEARKTLESFKPDSKTDIKVVFAYMQTQDYQKGSGTANEGKPLPVDAFATLTRIGRIVGVRSVTNINGDRFYIDIELGKYPFDRDGATANAIVQELRAKNAIPMKSYISVSTDNGISAFFAQAGTDAQAFSSVVDRLSQQPSQFSKDTFWRISRLSFRTKSLLPMKLTKEIDVPVETRVDGNAKRTFLKLPDQSILYMYLQFHRGQEHGVGYRSRRISLEGSPKASADLVLSSFFARSFGQETVAVNIPSTSSLSEQSARFSLVTQPHKDDEQQDYPYGPQVALPVAFRKSYARAALAVISVCAASGLFGWAALATSVLASKPISGDLVPLSCRVAAIVGGVLASLYAYYLWNDDLSLDKARRG